MLSTVQKLKGFFLSRDVVFSVVVVFVWRVMLELYAIFALHRFPLTDTINQPWYWLTIWYNYDGHHFVSLARNGYGFDVVQNGLHNVQYAFFPLFPLAIKLVSLPATLLVGDKLSIYILSGLLVTTASLAGAIYFLIQISRKIFDADTGKRTAFLLLFFPSAIFLSAVYTESSFLLWVTGSFYFALGRNWKWASLFAAGAASTRLVGSILFVCIALEFWLTYKGQWRQHLKEVVWLLLIPLSVVLYLAYQWIMVGNPLYFLEAQNAWGRSIDVSLFESLWKDFSRGLNLLDFRATMIAPMYDGLSVLFGVGMAIILAIKRMWSFALFTLVVTVISLASGTTVGAIRYVIVAFPAFLLLGYWSRHQIVFSFLLAFFAIFFSLLSIHYLNTWWLA